MYQKITRKLFPIILFLFPFVGVNRGIEYSDTTCAIANFMNFDKLEGLWKFGYYLSLLVGKLLMSLPYGETMLGLRIYTTLFICALALTGYFFCKNLMPHTVAFLGSVLAIALSWCTSFILYNYVTYWLLLIAIVCLYSGLTKNKKSYLFLAGVILAWNVFARFPNLMEIALIFAVWYYAILKKEKVKQILIQTATCITGYITGLLTGLGLVAVTDSMGDFFQMIRSVLSLTEDTQGYTFSDMLSEIFQAYINVYKFELVMLVAAILGAVIFILLDKLNNQKWKSRLIILAQIGCPLCLVGMYFWFYRREFFEIDYYSYGSILKPVTIFITISLISSIWVMVTKRADHNKKLLAAFVFLTIMITPLGSNNGIFPVINNLFLIAPFTLMVIYDFCVECGWIFKEGKTKEKYTAKLILFFLIVLLLFQSICFHNVFTFRDGGKENEISAKVTADSRLAGMRTTKLNAQELNALITYLKDESEAEDRELIAFGNLPGLYYLLDRKPAVTDLWPDLVTNDTNRFVEDLTRLTLLETKKPIVILSRDVTYDDANEKYQAMTNYLTNNNYQLTYESVKFAVYLTEE